MFALIKWVEDGKFSILPTEHIKGFDDDEYAAGLEKTDIYLVEWRQGVREPKGGWPVYEASVIKIAERERTLEIKLKELEEQLPKPDSQTLKRKSRPSMKLLEATEVRSEPAAKKKVQLTDLPNDVNEWNERKIEHLQRVINQLREENMNLNKENQRLKNEILEKIPPLLLATEHLLQEPMKSNADVSDMSKTPSRVSLSHAPNHVESNADVLDHNSKMISDGDMVPKAPSKASLSGSAKCSSDANYVELAHGTGIKILKHQWTSALQAPTATSMVRVLLMAAFPLEVLIHSNLKGGKSKTDDSAERRNALDKETMSAIYVAVKKRFPNVSRGALGIAVNSKLGELRLIEKKKI